MPEGSTALARLPRNSALPGVSPPWPAPVGRRGSGGEASRWSASRSSLCADRAAIEKVYHEHRLGHPQPFEQRLPLASIERLVQLDLKKEATLKRRYGIEISPAQVESEVKRIDATTRAPDVLAELRKALSNDPARFARAVARPLVVER